MINNGDNEMTNEQLLAEVRLLQKYPQAVKAKIGVVAIGDVIANHIDIPAILVTQDVFNRMGDSDHSHFYIIARTH